MSKIDKPPTIEGLRHARNLLAKQLEKERQRAADLKIRNTELLGEIEILKRKLKFISKRYGA